MITNALEKYRQTALFTLKCHFLDDIIQRFAYVGSLNVMSSLDSRIQNFHFKKGYRRTSQGQKSQISETLNDLGN